MRTIGHSRNATVRQPGPDPGYGGGRAAEFLGQPPAADRGWGVSYPAYVLRGKPGIKMNQSSVAAPGGGVDVAPGLAGGGLTDSRLTYTEPSREPRLRQVVRVTPNVCNVRLGKLGHGVGAATGRARAPSGYAVCNIVRLGSQEKMGRIAAGRVVACMPNYRPGRQGAIVKRPGHLMCEAVTTLVAQLAIAESVPGAATPGPALARPPSIDKGPEALLGMPHDAHYSTTEIVW